MVNTSDTSKAVAPTTSHGSHEKLRCITDTTNFIDNRFVPSQATEWFEVKDPATNYLVTRVPQSTQAELETAVASCQNAFPAWKATSIMRRQQVIFKLTHLIRENMDRIARVITLEQGKTFADAKGDVLRGLQVCETACGITTQITGEVIEVSKDMETRSYREPLGVTAAICPFNFPAMIPLWSLPLALVTGNTLLLKPSERDPGAAMVIAELCAEAGVPPGVLNVVHGAHDTVNFILDNPVIKAVSFVGSNRAGEYVYTRGTAQGKRVQANLGAKNHAALLPDCNKNHALAAIVGAAFGAAGQRCMALSALVLVGETKSWIPQLVERACQLKINGGFEKDADLGPLISPESKKRAEDLIASAEAEGATIVLDGRGKKPADKNFARGNWLGPTIIANVKPSMRCYREEIFGPVLVCLSVDTIQDAVDLINNNEYGNGAAVFTNSGSVATLFQRSLETGQIGINVPIPVPLPMFSFTGNKRSVAGTGVSNFYGKDGIRFYTQWKTVTSLWRAEDAHRTEKQVVMPRI
ncbi:methylmalonate-semialdehyde dehydrogenase (acylating) [Verruconis gallopava]|uniref:methylmalonate-semialdehyde dehydrogenase (CoA acylating) n=1 Tax=Verruconis gallopava TaxID=253628 RepID=A0A0D2AEQ8_9PEZI|nr:methylmalonate-semialdehyde dehydrogenase (acylating) [Verruconis gallopava]KIW04925.1 methylmalonate-semialdehyde dehydrogenase (acylating) [Verruconis gallopava]